MSIVQRFAFGLVLLTGLSIGSVANGQAFGVLLQGNLNPAAGGMGGVGIANPQDVQSALALNPATLSQKKGTQFSFSGSWVEPTINMDNDATIGPASISPFDSKSRRPGSIVGNIAVSQDFTALGYRATAGMGLLTASGLGVNYRDVGASNGTTAELVALATAMGVGVEVTDRLSIGALLSVATTSMDGIFTAVAASTPDYNLRGSFGITYELFDATTIGAFWQTEQKHTFDDFVRFGPPGSAFQDLSISFPNVYGVGIADQSLMDGRLLLGIDFTYIDWSSTDFFGAIWKDQTALQLGAQFDLCRGIRLRAGYAYVDDASRNVVAPTIGGITPQAGVDYIQALFPNSNEHRISGGIGVKDLLPGVDVDLFAGGMFNDSHDFGQSTVSVASYWVGFGTTWRFGRGGCGCLRVPNQF